MKATIHIPKGWRRLRGDDTIGINDLVLDRIKMKWVKNKSWIGISAMNFEATFIRKRMVNNHKKNQEKGLI